MSHSGYAKLERGETEIGLARVEELAKVFQVNIVTLLQLDIPNVNISGTLQSSGNIASPNATLHITAHTHDGLLEKTMRRMLLLEQQVRDAGFEPIG
jgi:transcriptional regulator with XRE-family HTH domain